MQIPTDYGDTSRQRFVCIQNTPPATALVGLESSSKNLSAIKVMACCLQGQGHGRLTTCMLSCRMGPWNMLHLMCVDYSIDR